MSTHKQKLVAKKIMENRGKSISEAMRESGYSKATAKNPSNLTNSAGWKELMEEYISEKKLLEVHLALLSDKNWRARAYALDKAYRLLGKYDETKSSYVDPDENLTDDELDEEIKKLEIKIKKRYNESTLKSITPAQ